jgi:predicted DsbA family dithiol-disulfide isomerase
MDFACLQCFIVSLELERLRREQAVDIHWRCLMPRPLNAAPMPLAARKAEKEQRRRVAERIQIEHGIALKPGPIGIQTYAAHLAVKYARARNIAGDLHRALMRAYWLEGRSIGNLEVIKEIGAQLGLDAIDLAARVSESLYAEGVAVDAQCAAKVGVRRAPALLFANKYLVSGTQPIAVWRAVLHRVRARENRRPRLELSAGLQTLPGQKPGMPVLVFVGNPQN